MHPSSLYREQGPSVLLPAVDIDRKDKAAVLRLHDFVRDVYFAFSLEDSAYCQDLTLSANEQEVEIEVSKRSQ